MSPQHRFASEKGSGFFGLLLFFIIFIILILLLDQAYITKKKCAGEELWDCALDSALDYFGGDKQEETPEGSVTATGVISREFKGSTKSVTVTMTFPLEGGKVTGSFSGDCDGNISGTYAGGDGGGIEGKGNGSCAFVFPASGSFSGSVNKTSKTVNVSGRGSAAGFSGEDSLTLTY